MMRGSASRFLACAFVQLLAAGAAKQRSQQDEHEAHHIPFTPCLIMSSIGS
jgi:hypothetical protein